MKKKILVLLFCFFIMGIMGGCSEKPKSSFNNQGEEVNKGEIWGKDSDKRGRYIEKELKISDLAEGEKIISVSFNKGKIEAYTENRNKYFCYTLVEADVWKKQDVSWINSIPELKKKDGLKI